MDLASFAASENAEVFALTVESQLAQISARGRTAWIERRQDTGRRSVRALVVTDVGLFMSRWAPADNGDPDDWAVESEVLPWLWLAGDLRATKADSGAPSVWKFRLWRRAPEEGLVDLEIAGSSTRGARLAEFAGNCLRMIYAAPQPLAEGSL